MKDIERLSFVRGNGRGLNCWQVEAESLPHMQQERLGRAMADEAIAYMRTTGFTPLLGWVVQAMGGRLSPVAIGFFDEICKRAMK